MYHPERRWRACLPSWLGTSMVVFALVALLCARPASADDLTQTYCSSENTGSDMSPQQSIYQSNGRCTGNCTDLFGTAYAFAIVQGDNCWCSDYIPEDQVSVGSCNTPCVGYPYENCGNEGAGLFGYIQIGRPSGVAGGSSPSSSGASDSSSDETSSAQAQTIFNSVTVTNQLTTTISPSVSVLVSTFTATPSTNASPTPTTPTPTPTPPSSSSDSQISPTSSSPSPMTSVQILTISNKPVTQTVTSTPTAFTASDPGQQQPIQQSSSKVSAGLIAGVVVAAVVASLAITALLFFCWRRRKQQELDVAAAGMVESGATSSRPTRNTSVLSKTGLLEKVYPSAATAQRSHANSNTTDTHGGVSPISERRRSQPLFYDQRLNPTTLMSYDNGSRVSVNTLPDNRDFSRTLNVTNPDPRDSWQ